MIRSRCAKSRIPPYAGPFSAAPAGGAASTVSLVISVYNERENVLGLYEATSEVLIGMRESYEIIWVDDSITDGTDALLRDIAAKERSTRVIALRRNFGRNAASMACIDHVAGDVINPMGGDGQNDPADIPHLLDKLAEGYDVDSGCR